MKFVKYVSAGAEGDRWDLIGNYRVVENEDEDEDGPDEEGGGQKEEEWKGFED